MFFYKTDQKLISEMRCHLCSITSEMIKFTTSKLFVFCNFSVSAYLLENKNDKLLDLFFGKMTPFLPCNLFTVHFFFLSFFLFKTLLFHLQELIFVAFQFSESAFQFLNSSFLSVRINVNCAKFIFWYACIPHIPGLEFQDNFSHKCQP